MPIVYSQTWSKYNLPVATEETDDSGIIVNNCLFTRITFIELKD